MSTVTDTTSATSTTSTSSTTSANVMTTDDFLKVLMTQLANQDPLEPMDNSQLLEQMSTIQSMQTTQKLTAALQLSQASGLIGVSITGMNASGVEVTGQVESVSLDDDSPYLIVNGTKVALEDVTRIVQDTDQAIDQALMLDSIVATNQLTAAMELSQASALIGKTVTGTDSDGQEVTGIVERATVAGDSVSLIVGDSTLPLANVTEVLSS